MQGNNTAENTEVGLPHSISYTTSDSYCNAKSAVALSLNSTYNWFGNVRNFCKNFIYSPSHCVVNRVHSKISYTPQRQTDLWLRI